MSDVRVLLVNNSADEREMYGHMLRRLGFCTLLASTAADGYRLASELEPAAIVTDVRLGGAEDGFELTRRLKAEARTQRVPVVMLTASLFTHDRGMAARAGCDLVLQKPCLPEALVAIVERLVTGQLADDDGLSKSA